MIKLMMILLLSSGAYAESFYIFKQAYDFKEEEGLLVNGCVDKNCDALKAISNYREIDLKAARKNLKFSNSVGSDVCIRIYKVKAVLGEATNQDARAFCYFPDNSMVEMNSLSNYLTSKKIVVE